MNLCAVIVTHARPPLYEPRLPVPYIVSTDNPNAAVHHLWNAKYIDVGVFSDTERAIGAHIHGALNAVFATFPECTAASLLEDDVEISSDYFAAVGTTLSSGFGCFTCINDRGDLPTSPPWSPHALRPVTYSIGIGMAVSRALWTRQLNQTWGVEYWDNFLRTSHDLVCLSPEISRCRHHARRDSMHGTGGPAAALARLPTHGIETFSNLRDFIVRPPPEPASCGATRNARTEVHRGSYYGLDERGCRIFHPPTPSGLAFTWIHGAVAQSCTAICAISHLSCSPRGLQEPQSHSLAHFSGCTHYGSESGRELPSSIALSSNTVVCNVPWFDQPASCSAWHPRTRRLCPCFKPTKHNAVYYL